MGRIPKSAAILNKCRVPLGIIITPFASSGGGGVGDGVDNNNNNNNNHQQHQEQEPLSPNQIPQSLTSDNLPLIKGPIVRCRRCRSYLNPYIIFQEGMTGQRWKCNLCFIDNEFPSNYDFNPTTQSYIPRTEHKELCSSIYEFQAPSEYMIRAPQAPTYVFVLDVSWNSISSGMMAASLRVIGDSLDELPPGDRSRVSLVTFDQSLHFWSFESEDGGGIGGGVGDQDLNGLDITEPKMLVVADLEGDASNPLIPAMAENVLLRLTPFNKERFSRLLRRIAQDPSMFAAGQAIKAKQMAAVATAAAAGNDNQQQQQQQQMQFQHQTPTEVQTAGAIATTIKLLGPTGGKILVMQASPPSPVAGSRSRQSDAVLGSAKEDGLLQPSHALYKNLATEATKLQVSIDLFISSPNIPSSVLDNDYDLPTLASIAKFTGGRLHHYPQYSSSSPKYPQELMSLLGQALGLECVVRVRASQGLTITSYYGSFFLRSTDLLSLPSVNLDHSIGAQLSIDDKITSGQMASLQVAVLYTSSGGERRIRVINCSIPLTESHQECLDHVDQMATAALLAKMASEKALSSRLEDARDAIQNKLIDVLLASKAIYKVPASTPNILLPPSLALLPLLLHAMTKNAFIRSGDITGIDRRIHLMTRMLSLSVPQTLFMLYPCLLGIHSMSSECGLADLSGGVGCGVGVDNNDNTIISSTTKPTTIIIPPSLPLSSTSLQAHGLYLAYDGEDFYLFIGPQIHPELAMLIFGVRQEDLPPSNTATYYLPELDNDWSQRLRAIVGELQRRTLVRDASDCLMTGNPPIYLVRPSAAAAAKDSVKRRFELLLVEDQLLSPSTGLISGSYSTFLSNLRDKHYLKK